MDWSENPLIALFFAVEKQGLSPTVCVYHAQEGQIVDKPASLRSPFGITKTRIMKPSVHSLRVALQKGWHTVHRLHPRKSGGKMMIPLQKMKWHDGRLSIIAINPAFVSHIRHELAVKGIKRETVYGDFENMCLEIRKGICGR